MSFERTKTRSLAARIFKFLHCKTSHFGTFALRAMSYEQTTELIARGS